VAGRGRVREGSHDASASADAVGSQFGSQVADRLCSTYLDHNSAWWARTRLFIRKVMYQIEW